jgi:hypothetical protein
MTEMKSVVEKLLGAFPNRALINISGAAMGYLGRICGVGGILLFLFSCRTPFDPEPQGKSVAILVVEGYLDADGKKSELRLSRMTDLDSLNAYSPELNATAYLESSAGTRYYLEEKGDGIYLFEETLSFDLSYRLSIQLQNGEQYQSDEIIPIETPEILDAGFVKDEEGVEIFVNTQGNEQADDFLWTFQEDWIFRPYTLAPFIYDQTLREVRDRTPSEDIYTCFRTEPNPGILLETSSRFQEQVVFRQTITEIPTGDERLQARYSILINQMAIPSDAVKFWEILKKNTEEIGSIFSPLPAVISGNIHGLETSNLAVGQVNIGKVRQRRIYINRADVSPWNYSNEVFSGCYVDDVPLLIGSFEYHFLFGSGSHLPARPFLGDGPILATYIIGYNPIETRCADCTLYASKVKPDFWEDE